MVKIRSVITDVVVVAALVVVVFVVVDVVVDLRNLPLKWSKSGQ